MKISGFNWSRTKSFTPYRASVVTTIGNNSGLKDNAYAAVASVTGLPAAPLGQGRFGGGLVQKDGRVLLLPADSGVANFYMFDPATNVLAVDSALGSWNGSGVFWGGAMLDDDRAVLAAYSHAEVKVYNVKTKTMIGIATGLASAYKFQGAVPTKDGRVVLVPHGSANIFWIEPNGTTLTQGPAHGEPDRAFGGGVLMPNGKILLIPSRSNYFGIFDPSNNTYVRGPSTTSVFDGTTSAKWAGGVLTANGKVIIIPSRETRIMQFDPETGLATVADTISAHPTEYFSGGALLADGRVLFAPGAINSPMSFDPATNDATWHTTTETTVGALFRGAVAIPGGGALLVPALGPNVGRFASVYNAVELSNAVLTSGFYNKAI